MKEIQDREQLKHYLRAFQLESVFHEPLRPHLSLYGFEPGDLICTQGQAAEYLYVLVHGKLKIYTTSSEGKTLVLSFKTPLEVIGDVEYVRGTPILNTVEAVTSVCMIGVHYRWLHNYGKDHAPLLQFLLEIITQKFYVKSNSLSFNLMYPVEVRLASYLLSVTSEESDSRLEGVSLSDAANFIGTSYRHLNRVIRQFCIQGLVERHKGIIVVKDRNGLSALAGHNIYENHRGKGETRS
ncbi:Crp/Fnr family transcriptional regulator [Paenibacillus ehimensis]|uniref:Cyclic nucleotide-binding domain-containing protein n=1 Tax=Paenibacillus ehimensis TaxID=79264 RepID=A0ABT8V8A1_9BACL|nr:cyclic nucleotide-binding domain-containing protein [Paenibacillus ehimensis]MDO3676175.1 cyclic nucleotide-binding domain-containing protein [Paenibacillus ehimensis]